MSSCNNQNKVSASNPSNQQLNNGIFKTVTSNNPNLFDPNKILAAVNTYNSLNYTVNKMLGLDVKYFRSIPQQRSKDVFLLEYTLYNVDDTPICMKVMTNAGNIPDDKYNYDLMGLEYEIPFEIQIDKKYWEDTVGFGTAPQHKDILYFPLSNKIYQIESSYLKRGFMQQETTWIINLKKYTPEASRKEGELLSQTLNEYTASVEELFGDDINANIEKITNDKQFSPLNSTSKDKYKSLDKTLSISANQLNVNSIIVIQSQYDMQSSTHYKAISYTNSNDTFDTSTERSLLNWFNIKPTSDYADVVWIRQDNTLPSPANYKLKINGNKNLNIGDNITIYRQGSFNLFAKIIDNVNLQDNIYYIKIDTQVLTYLNNLNSTWTELKNYKIQLTEPINFLEGIYNKLSVLNISLYANQYLKTIFNNKEYISILPYKLNNNEWYSMVINLNNNLSTLNTNIYKQDNALQLKSILNNTQSISQSLINIDEYSINKSNSYLTNIKLFDMCIDNEQHVNELLSYFTKNAEHALILDNADSLLKLEYVGKPK